MEGEDNKDHFLYRRKYPDVKSAFGLNSKSKEDILNKAFFVLDANSLLTPYLAGKDELESIRKIYAKLIEEERLYLPEHAIREYVANRPSKISDLYTQIDNKISLLPSIKPLHYPILESLKTFQELNKKIENLKNSIKEYKDHLELLKADICDWRWNDPVNKIYSELFVEKMNISSKLDEKDLLALYDQRLKDDIPPGNKDQNKPTNAIGDFLIWQSILELGANKKVDIVFVTNDEKNDWMLKGNKKSITTKYELVDEYHRETKGNNFLCINFSDFLASQGLSLEFDSELIGYFHFDETSNRKLNSLVALDDIYSVLKAYNKGHFVGSHGSMLGEIEFSVSAFKHQYLTEFNSENLWPRVSKYLESFSNILPQIEQLNHKIKYEEQSMKRDTTQELNQMRSLINQFIEEYEEFKEKL